MVNQFQIHITGHLLIHVRSSSNLAFHFSTLVFDLNRIYILYRAKSDEQSNSKALLNMIYIEVRIRIQSSAFYAFYLTFDVRVHICTIERQRGGMGKTKSDRDRERERERGGR